MAEIEQKLQEYKASHICIIGKRGVIMETLAISPDFTIEDIHKIREQNYEKTKDMSVAEKVAYYNNSGKEAEEEINRRRALKQRTIASV